MSEWYERSFGEDYLLVYKHRDVQGAKREVHQMISWLGLPEGAKVLDLCCGMGRHSMELYEVGYQVTGIDLSGVLLREARNNDTDNKVNWVQSDMRNLPFDGGYDAVVNLFTSFGYFEQDEEHIQVLKEIRRMLKPNGQFIIDFLNPQYTKTHLVPHSERVDEGQRIIENRVIENGYVKKYITITDEQIKGSLEDSVQQPRHYLERIRLYSKDEFVLMMHEAGLKIDQIYGDYNEEAYDCMHSPRMIMIGTVE